MSPDDPDDDAERATDDEVADALEDELANGAPDDTHGDASIPRGDDSIPHGTDEITETGTDDEVDTDGTDDEVDTDGTDDGVGTVFLVGSGPGDPALLTVRARELLEAADVVLHDKLPGPEILETIPAAKREDVGKRAGGDRTPQAEINQRLVDLASAGHDVVRLKGGDPFVFGRGGEEAEYLADHEIPFEVVPGVTSAIGGAGVAGIPVTHRDHASSVSFVTGHEDPTKAESAVDWSALAQTGGTIVVLMGVGRLPDYSQALLDAGMPPDTPLALVERATWPDMRVVTGTLGTATATRDDAAVEPPAITVIGEVAATRDHVKTFLANDRARSPAAAGEDGQQ